MTTSHTPAPWTAMGHIIVASVPTDAGYTAAVIATGSCAGAGWRYACDPASFENLANTRLMAAAPTLLAALQKYRDQYGSPDTWPADEVECLAAADAAIKQATEA